MELEATVSASSRLIRSRYAAVLGVGLQIKTIEQRLGDPNVRLESFIVSNTPSHTTTMLWGMDKQAMTARHILFQEEEDKETCVRTMLEKVSNPSTDGTTRGAI